jgi:Uma2 family endonuclease
MKNTIANKIYTLQEYILLEESGEVRHEYINGNLIEMSGASREHHRICKYLLRLLEDLLAPNGYEIFIENMKVAIPNEDKYFYPDIFVTKELQTESNRYIQKEPSLIIEVLSESTRTKDMVDKFIQYRKIETLQYYMVVDSEKCLVMLYFLDANKEWDVETFTKKEEVLQLPKLDIKIPLTEIYK